jgi:hypothetical protein
MVLARNVGKRTYKNISYFAFLFIHNKNGGVLNSEQHSFCYAWHASRLDMEKAILLYECFIIKKPLKYPLRGF